MKRRSEKIVKSHTEWRKQSFVKKIRIVMTMVLVAMCVSAAAGGILAWLYLKNAVSFQGSSSSQSETVSNYLEELPVYDNSFSLVLVNSTIPLSSDYQPQLQVFNGIKIDGRILPALKSLMQTSQNDGCPLVLKGGYISPDEQNELFQTQVQTLMTANGLTQVRAENEAQSAVGKANYNENQTGLSVEFSVKDLADGTDFSTTQQYRWLIRNCVDYGFVLRYPENKTSATGMAYEPAHFRYVGTSNAQKMRQLSMCLEEYVSYLSHQTN